jgi:hypothetical protein
MECKHGFKVIRCTVASMLREELHLAFVLPRLLKRGKRPRLRRLPVDSLLLREYKRYSPDLSLRIIRIWMRNIDTWQPRPTRDQNRVCMLNECCKRRRTLQQVTPRVTPEHSEGNPSVSKHLQFSFSTKG